MTSPVQGAFERIAALRNRNEKAVASMEKYEALVAQQSEELGRINQSNPFDFRDEKLNNLAGKSSEDVHMTEDDLRREEEGIAELERKKQVLEERVHGMEKDLGGLMR